MCRVATGFSFDDFDNDNLLNFTEKRQCIRDRAPRFARVLPANHGKLQLKCFHLRWNHQDWSTGLHHNVSRVLPARSR
jgi:hypothetical protein